MKKLKLWLYKHCLNYVYYIESIYFEDLFKPVDLSDIDDGDDALCYEEDPWDVAERNWFEEERCPYKCEPCDDFDGPEVTE